MPNWKKVIVSGSDAQLNSLKLTGIDNAGVDTDKFLVLDANGNIDYRTGTQTLSDINPGGLLSGSAQIASEISGAFTSTSASIAVDITSLNSSVYGDSDVTDHINSLDVHSGSYLGTADTDDLTEGSTNLYYTDGRVKTKLNTEGVVSGSSQVIIGSTTGYTSFSSSIAGDITSLSNSALGKYAASGSRMAVWRDGDTIRGYDSLHYFDKGGSDIGIRLNPSSVTGRTIRTGQAGGTTGVQILITRTPSTTYGATIDYIVFNSLVSRSAYRIGREISVWDNSGGNITGTGYTSFAYGTLPADLEVSVIESSGEMFLNMTWSGGGTYYISANIDTFGAGI